MSITVRLQSDIFDPGAETNAFLTAHTKAGAAVTFTGLVRSDPTNPITSLTLEHYPPVAQAQLEEFANRAIARFGLLKATVIHRYGKMLPNEPIVQVMTLAPHRNAAFEGAQFIMDFLKTDAPFWKKETSPTGENWVDAKIQDDTAKLRWE
ncbi:MAG: molybdenum cofactor biosynthesis protein MoaE [Devosiaceae bacterium]|nr:molybdenum cofactor biosynthesis protein MoaE [Devosiaceae bacterium]